MGEESQPLRFVYRFSRTDLCLYRVTSQESKLAQLFCVTILKCQRDSGRLTKITMATGNVWVDLQSVKKESFRLLREKGTLVIIKFLLYQRNSLSNIFTDKTALHGKKFVLTLYFSCFPRTLARENMMV